MPILLIRVNTNALRLFLLSHLRASLCYTALRHRNIRARRIVYRRKWAKYFARNARSCRATSV